MRESREATTLNPDPETVNPNLLSHLQEVVRGRSLTQMVAAGRRAAVPEVERIACELLRIAEYLSSLSPPVVHRDIKPDNIILEGSGEEWGGRVFLVDFGGVQVWGGEEWGGRVFLVDFGGVQVWGGEEWEGKVFLMDFGGVQVWGGEEVGVPGNPQSSYPQSSYLEPYNPVFWSLDQLTVACQCCCRRRPCPLW